MDMETLEAQIILSKHIFRLSLLSPAAFPPQVFLLYLHKRRQEIDCEYKPLKSYGI